MSEKEYQSHQGKKSLWYLLLIIIILALIKTCIGGEWGTSTENNDSITAVN